jgi:hypothetical protein
MKVENREKDCGKKSELMIPNTTRTGSGDCKLDGSMAMTQLQTPITQIRLISPEDRRRMIRSIRGILKSGMIIPLSIPMI